MEFLSKHRSWIGPTVSAVLAILAFPPFSVTPFIFFALVPLLWCLENTTTKQAYRRGYLFGLVFGLGELHWLGAMAANWLESWTLAVIPWWLATVLFAIYFGLIGRLIRTCNLLRWTWAIPLVWAGMEVFRSYIPVLAFPWALLAYPLAKSPVLMQGAHFGSVALVSAAVVAVNQVLLGQAHLILGKRRFTVSAARSMVAAGLTAVVVFGAGAVRMLPRTSRSTLTVAAVQPAVNMASLVDPDPELHVRIPRLLTRAKEQGAELAILPEGIARGGDSLPPKMPFELVKGLPILFGGQRGKHITYQSAFAYDGKWQYADKTRLVIFGEFVPGRDFLPFLSAFHLPSGDLSAGHEVKSLDIAGHRLAPLICFEALFPDLAYRRALQGSRFLAVMSIDDWFAGSQAPEVLRDAAAWRAVETGLPVVRAGSLGYTAIYDDRGQMTGQSPWGEPSTLVAQVPLDAPGPWPGLPVFPAVCLLSLVAIPVVARVRLAKQATSDESASQ